LLELISKAGGLSKAADASRVMILRDFNEKVETRYIDLTTLEFINSDFYYLRQNDEIYVLPDRLSQILDYGSLRYMGWGVTTSLVAILNYINS
jgi:polysaccharide export outer membrane protein